MGVICPQKVDVILPFDCTTIKFILFGEPVKRGEQYIPFCNLESTPPGDYIVDNVDFEMKERLISIHPTDGNSGN